MKMVDIQQINRELVCDPAGFARQANAAYDAQIEAVARDLRARRDEHPILLLSGPSGSGKTTTALKIEKLLESWGCVAHTLSLDNYFLPFSEEGMEQVRRGLIDLESPARVDAELLGAQLSDMVAGKSVPLPRALCWPSAAAATTAAMLTPARGSSIFGESAWTFSPCVRLKSCPVTR